MKLNKSLITFIIVLVLAIVVTGIALAEDGLLFRRNVSKTPDAETEQAGFFMMDFYVPAQSSAGLVGPIGNYLLPDETVAYEPRYYAKPLISVYNDGYADIHYYGEEGFLDSGIQGGMTFGAFDGFVAVSLDDGTSWKTTNLSNSAEKSSFTLKDGTAFPGDVPKIVHQVFGDNILVVWSSRYCAEGTPLYSLSTGNNFDANAEYFEDLETTYGKDAIYLYDLFGVAGTQGSVDYTEQGYPEVGEIPYACIWTARGKLLAGDDPATADTVEATYVMWTKPERLTSGTRDANLPAVDCAAGAGCMLTWQEDPEGLRPGQGLGPGEGWSGAIAWQQTDIWYSHIGQADFDLVFDMDGTVGEPISMTAYAELADATMPKAYVPLAMPVRLTDNAMCKGAQDDIYCYIDFDTIDDIDHTNVQTLFDLTEPEAGADFCATIESWTNPGGTTIDLCVTEDNRRLDGRVAATRVRLNLKPYDSDGDTVNDSAWIIMAAEESKALGDGDPENEEDPVDIGKNVWYYSFDPFKSGSDHAMVLQGGMLNQPAVCSEHDLEQGKTCTVGEFFDIQLDDRGNEYYLTEIARRFALTTNSSSAIVNSESGLSAMLIYKQGIINQGGPADIFLRRVVIPDTFDPTVDNPYAFENIDCAEWAYTDGSNPNYLQGLCLSPAINISGNTIVECEGAIGNDACADLFPVNDDGSIPEDPGAFPKLLEWRQCDGASAIEGCEVDNDLDDQSWENPFDIAKGHRGFLDGDFVMMMYAWSPNWKANTVGNDHYNLYVRRSFDGGLTWTTTPASLDGTGTTATENYCVGMSSEECVGTEFTYAAGDFEQGRNVSQLIGNKVTILDPRYSPTGGLKLYPTILTDWLETNIGAPSETLPYEDDLVRDPSKFFMIYETGDNTTSEFGEATPLDLFYSRATVYGDVWELDPDYVDPETGEILDYRWNWAEHDQEDLSGEAAMSVNPGGTFMYAVWNQWKEEIIVDPETGEEHELIYDADMPFRRFLYLPDDSNVEAAPLTRVIYQSHKAALYKNTTLLTFVGSARDFDKLGDTEIVAYEWRSNKDGLLGDGRTLDILVTHLSVGPHIITFRAQDAEGNWSAPAKVYLLVGDQFYTTGVPIIVK
jgi:hypothetical protein